LSISHFPFVVRVKRRAEPPDHRRNDEVSAGENLDEAIEWANKVPLQSGAIEIRAVMDLSPYGYESKTLTPVRATA
jgi:hypothetical protein